MYSARLIFRISLICRSHRTTQLLPPACHATLNKNGLQPLYMTHPHRTRYKYLYTFRHRITPLERRVNLRRVREKKIYIYIFFSTNALLSYLNDCHGGTEWMIFLDNIHGTEKALITSRRAQSLRKLPVLTVLMRGSRQQYSITMIAGQ